MGKDIKNKPQKRYESVIFKPGTDAILEVGKMP